MRCKICTRSYANSARKYGDISCNLCVAFFHRSVQLKKNYVCKSSNDCLKEPSLEGSQCQKCRLSKCFELGMTKPQMSLKCPVGAFTQRRYSQLESFKLFCHGRNTNGDVAQALKQ